VGRRARSQRPATHASSDCVLKASVSQAVPEDASDRRPAATPLGSEYGNVQWRTEWTTHLRCGETDDEERRGAPEHFPRFFQPTNLVRGRQIPRFPRFFRFVGLSNGPQCTTNNLEFLAIALSSAARCSMAVDAPTKAGVPGMRASGMVPRGNGADRNHSPEEGGSLDGATRMPASISLDTESIPHANGSPEAERARYGPGPRGGYAAKLCAVLRRAEMGLALRRWRGDAASLLAV
jgi:hypothetical protein